MIILRKDLLHEISNLAYVIADVSEDRESPHSLHQTFDICEEGNIDRVDSLLTLAAAEAAEVLSPIARFVTRKGNYHLIIKPQTRNVDDRLRPVAEKTARLIREYMVASVLAGWLSVTLPSAAPFWTDRKEETAAALQTAVDTATCRPVFTRAVPPM